MHTVYNMPDEFSVRRENLSDAAEAVIRDMIVDGRLAAGERINEVHLALRLGLSRTPLREALNRLVSEGAIESRPRIGYFVKPLTLAECDQIYDLRPILDPAALSMAGLPSARQLSRLEALNRKIVRDSSPQAFVALDEEWHLALLEHCPNRALVEIIQGVMMRTRRYELALIEEEAGPERAAADHQRILTCLARSDLNGACEALKLNMQNGKAPIMAWLERRRAG